MTQQKRVIGVVIREGVCQKTDDEIIYGALMSKVFQQDNNLYRMRRDGKTGDEEYRALTDERDRTFALLERHR